MPIIQFVHLISVHFWTYPEIKVFRTVYLYFRLCGPLPSKVSFLSLLCLWLRVFSFFPYLRRLEMLTVCR